MDLNHLWYAIYEPVEHLWKKAGIRPVEGFVFLGGGSLILYQSRPSNLWFALAVYGLAYPLVRGNLSPEADLIGHYKASPASINA